MHRMSCQFPKLLKILRQDLLWWPTLIRSQLISCWSLVRRHIYINGCSRKTTALQAQVVHALGYFHTTTNKSNTTIKTSPTQALNQVQHSALLINLHLLLLLLLPVAFCYTFRSFWPIIMENLMMKWLWFCSNWIYLVYFNLIISRILLRALEWRRRLFVWSFNIVEHVWLMSKILLNCFFTTSFFYLQRRDQTVYASSNQINSKRFSINVKLVLLVHCNTESNIFLYGKI